MLVRDSRTNLANGAFGRHDGARQRNQNLDLDQITKSRDRFSCVSGELGALQRTIMTTLKLVTIAAGLLVGGTSLAMAQYGGWYPGYGYGYGYAAAPLYDYAAPAYGYAAPAVAPATAGTTIVIVTPAPAYAPPVASGYYNYAPGYRGGYGWGRAGYWGGYGYGWR
jgi:hypothetical protein